MSKITNNMIRINEVELATKLAESATIDEVFYSDPDSEWCDGEDVIEKDDDGNYNPEIQPIFDRWYSYFMESIDICKIQD